MRRKKNWRSFFFQSNIKHFDETRLNPVKNGYFFFYWKCFVCFFSSTKTTEWIEMGRGWRKGAGLGGRGPGEVERSGWHCDWDGIGGGRRSDAADAHLDRVLIIGVATSPQPPPHFPFLYFFLLFLTRFVCLFVFVRVAVGPIKDRSKLGKTRYSITGTTLCPKEFRKKNPVKLGKTAFQSGTGAEAKKTLKKKEKVGTRVRGLSWWSWNGARCNFLLIARQNKVRRAKWRTTTVSRKTKHRPSRVPQEP